MSVFYLFIYLLDNITLKVVLFSSLNGFLGLSCTIFFKNFMCIFCVYGKMVIKQ